MVATINADTTNGVIITSDTSGEIELQANGVTKAKVTANGLQDANGASLRGGMYRNLIINGDMKIAQRGTSTAGVTSGGYNNIDRFGFYVGTAGTWTVSRDTDVPTNQGFTTSQKLDCTTANASLSSGSYIIYEQKIEAQNLQHLKFGTASAESLTLSFWVKSNKTGTYTLDLYVEDGTSQLSYTYTIDSVNTWEKKTVTIQGNTSNSINNDNGEGFRINWWLGTGTDFNSGTFNTSSWQTRVSANRVSPSQVNLADSTSNYINITGVQLEVGSGASDFEFLPYDVQLARCQRYCIQGDFAFAGCYGGGGGVPLSACTYNIPMRAAPSITYISGGTASDGISDFPVTGLYGTSSVTNKSARILLTQTGTSANARGMDVKGLVLKFDAEL
jgi:hypothetical protein